MRLLLMLLWSPSRPRQVSSMDMPTRPCCRTRYEMTIVVLDRTANAHVSYMAKIGDEL